MARRLAQPRRPTADMVATPPGTCHRSRRRAEHGHARRHRLGLLGRVAGLLARERGAHRRAAGAGSNPQRTVLRPAREPRQDQLRRLPRPLAGVRVRRRDPDGRRRLEPRHHPTRAHRDDLAGDVRHPRAPGAPVEAPDLDATSRRAGDRCVAHSGLAHERVAGPTRRGRGGTHRSSGPDHHRGSRPDRRTDLDGPDDVCCACRSRCTGRRGTRSPDRSATAVRRCEQRGRCRRGRGRHRARR